MLIEIRFQLKSHNEATFSPVQYRHSAQFGGVGVGWEGGGGGYYNRMYFFVSR